MSRLTGADAYGLMEAYSAVYAPQELTEEQVWEEVETWVNDLIEEGYDLSEYTWEEMYESYLEEAPMTAFQAAGGNAQLAKLNQGRSGRQYRFTPQDIETMGKNNLYKAGGGDAAINQGPQRNAGRGGMQPTLTRQDIINRGTVAGPTRKFADLRGSATPGSNTPKPTPTVTPTVNKKPGVTTVPIRPTPPTTPPTRTPAGTPPATIKVAPKPALGPTGKPLVGGIERRTPTSKELADAQAKRAAASKPNTTAIAFDKNTPNLLASTPTPAAPKPSTPPENKATGSKKPGSISASFDPFDVIKGHLLDEGYANTEEAALVIMANMSEEWRQSIVEGFPNVQNKPRPGYAGTGGLKLIQRPGEQPGYINKHSGGEILPSGTVDKIMGGNLMVKKDTKKNTNSNIA